MAITTNEHLLATTLDAYATKLTDNIFQRTALLDWVNKNAQTENGGYQIARPVIYDDLESVMTYQKYDTLNFGQSTFDAAIEADDPELYMLKYSWRQLAAGLGLSGIEMAQNNGEAAFINLVKTKLDIMESSIATKFNRMFYGNPPTSSTSTDTEPVSGSFVRSSKDFSGLKAAVTASEAASTRQVNFGGPSITDGGSFWNSQVDTVTESLSLGKLSTLYNSCSKGRAGDKPTFSLTTQALWEKYESMLQPNQRFTNAQMAEAGFDNIAYKTSTPVVWDPDCQSGVWYFLNPKYLYLVKHASNWMKHSKIAEREDKDASYWKITCYGEFICTNRSKVGKLTGKS